MPGHFINNRGRYTSPLIWAAAIACAILSTAVIVAAIVVLSIYATYRPKIPSVHVEDARLTKLEYDRLGVLDAAVALTIVAENGNAKAEAGFSAVGFDLAFHRIVMARLRAYPFDVGANGSVPLRYAVEASPVPLDEESMAAMDSALKNGVVPLDLDGQARTKWRVGIFLSLKYWIHLSCRIEFFWPNGSALNSDCWSKAHL
ncbi:uncharacterized protein [Typha angustifolia]|uniref:uncharacterized protein n=1 Tax=Typha angustifolia TaxID=59011 RepID=UPI003C2E9348